MNRTALVRLFAVLLTAGLLLALAPFFSSLSPSEQAIAALPRIKVPSLAPEQFKIVENPVSNNQSPSKLMLLRQKNGKLFVWSIPVRDGVFAMPDIHWWRPGMTCPSFAPDFANEVIACTGSYLPAWWREHLRWRLDGTNISGRVDDMPRIQGQERLGEFIFSMRRG